MGIGVSIFLMAMGAVLSWGVETNPQGVNLDNIGMILMLVGGLGLFVSLLLFQDWRPWSTRRDYVDDDVVTRRRQVDDEPVLRRSVVEDEPVVRRNIITERTYR